MQGICCLYLQTSDDTLPKQITPRSKLDNNIFMSMDSLAMKPKGTHYFWQLTRPYLLLYSNDFESSASFIDEKYMSDLAFIEMVSIYWPFIKLFKITYFCSNTELIISCVSKTLYQTYLTFYPKNNIFLQCLRFIYSVTIYSG